MLGIRKTVTALALTGAVTFGGLAATPAKADIIDLAFLVDSSTSIGASNWNIITAGLSQALGNLEATIGTDDTYRVTVVGFGTNAYQIVAPTEITSNAILDSVRSAVADYVYNTGAQFTNLGGAIDFLLGLFDARELSVGLGFVNVTTDGSPTVDAQGDTDATVVPNTGAENYAIHARDAALDAGWDSFSAEAIHGDAEEHTNFDWLHDEFVWPGPGTNAPPFPDPLEQGFVIEVQGFEQYAAAIDTKVRFLTGQIPEPASLSLLAIGLLGLAPSLTRRRRAC